MVVCCLSFGDLHFGSTQGENHGGDLQTMRYVHVGFNMPAHWFDLKKFHGHTSHPSFGLCSAGAEREWGAAWLCFCGLQTFALMATVSLWEIFYLLPFVPLGETTHRLLLGLGFYAVGFVVGVFKIRLQAWLQTWVLDSILMASAVEWSRTPSGSVYKFGFVVLLGLF